MWAIVCINTSKELYEESYSIKYDDILIEIERGDQYKGHQLRVECDEQKYKSAHQKIRRFLSEVSWLYECKIEVLNYGGASNKSTRFEGSSQYYNRIQGGLDLSDYQQVAFSRRQQVALGIYREAISSESVFYEFLCYSRIINLIGKESRQWKKRVNDNYKYISWNKDRVSEVLTRLQQNTVKKTSTLGDYTYHLGRCAIAHANNLKETADPDNFDDYDRISGERRLMQELAWIFINKELGIVTEMELNKLKKVQWFKNANYALNAMPNWQFCMWYDKNLSA